MNVPHKFFLDEIVFRVERTALVRQKPGDPRDRASEQQYSVEHVQMLGFKTCPKSTLHSRLLKHPLSCCRSGEF